MVVSETRGPRLESSHGKFFSQYLSTVICFEKTKIQKKRPGNAHFLLLKYYISAVIYFMVYQSYDAHV